jgi:hypothetical protein
MNTKNLKQITISLIVFSIVCLITAFIFNTSVQTVYYTKLSPEGGTLGPLKVDKANSVYYIHVLQSVPTNNWSVVSGSVLDENKAYLFGFGKELWRASGYDSDGAWAEARNDYETKITMQKGTYYLQFENETSVPKPRRAGIVVKVEQKRGSSLFFLIAGILGIIAGVIINEIANRTISTVIATMQSSD